MPTSAYAKARTPIVAGNWKLHMTYGEAVTLSQRIVDRLERAWKSEVEVVMCPPFTALRGVSNVVAFDGSYAKVGAQDCYWEREGAFTGEVSPAMLADLDCAWCIVGHSERRHLFGETSGDVARKAAALQEAGIAPILCVGEDLDVYDRGETVQFVRAQLAESIAGLPAPSGDFAVAYEPVWAIGSGMVPAPEHAQEVAAAVRAQLAEAWGVEAASGVRILYGGSVKPGNVAAFVGCADVDGVLVGGASLDADSFVDLVRTVVDA